MLGVAIKNINSELAKEKNIFVQKGVYVDGVSNCSGAMEAGIKSVDVIKQNNNTIIKMASKSQEQLSLNCQKPKKKHLNVIWRLYIKRDIWEV
ncbi:MAG: hypothetical protein M0P26_03590 [Bacteroidales bacterium]|jgi:S1-C subfamily serine protease|nr:hypothetical protein [Bacteroidales bacterium]